MNTNCIKISFIIISLITFFNCAPDGVDLSIDMEWISWTILDDSNNEPIFGAITNATVINISDEIQEITISSDSSGESFFSITFGGTIIYAEISAEGYTSQVFEDGDIPGQVRLTPL